MVLHCFFVVVSAALPLQAPSADAEAKLLRWKLDEGDQFRVHVVQTTETETKVKEKSTGMSVQTAMEMLWKVDRVDADGTIRMTQAFTRLAMKTTDSDSKTAVFDSASSAHSSEEIEKIARAVAPLLRSRFTAAMSARGEIIKVVPTGETESLLVDVPALSQWKRLLTTAGIRQTLRQSFAVLPESSVADGDTWTASYDIDSPVGKIQVANTYTYKGTESENGASFEKITVVTQTKVEAEEQPLEEAALPTFRQYTGVFYFDSAAGRLVQSKLTQELSSEVPYRDTKIQAKANSTIITTVTPANEE
jgi:hypothetical protein